MPNPLTPDATLTLFTVGVLLIYLELNRPGRIIPGALGLLLTLLALSRIQNPSPLAITLIATAAIVLALSLRRTVPLAASAAATLTLIPAFHNLFAPSPHWPASILCGLILGASTMYLTRVAHRARINKGFARG